MSSPSATAQTIWDQDVSQVRDRINTRIMELTAEKPEVLSVSDITLPEITIQSSKVTTPLRIYTPNKEDNLPIILMIHGGAWVGGNLDTHDYMARYLCRETQALVVSIGYLNAPEGKHPIPLEECYAALLWIGRHAKDYHADLTRLAVIGDSSGGNMAAALCLMVRDRKGPAINLQVLINPAPDLSCGGTITPQGDALDSMRWQAMHYTTHPQDVYNPYVSPLLAKDLSCLPPALILLAEKDSLRDDGQKYADRLSTAGVTTTVYIQAGTDHLAGNAARASEAARESLNVAVAALHHSFHRSEGKA